MYLIIVAVGSSTSAGLRAWQRGLSHLAALSISKSGASLSTSYAREEGKSKMTNVSSVGVETKLEELIQRVKQGEGRDPKLDCEIAAALQYIPDAIGRYTNVRAHPTSTVIMHYDSPTKEEIPTFIPMLTSSLDAVEKLRAWGRPNWKVDGLQAKNGEYMVRATSESGAAVQATASTEVRARLVAVLHAFQQDGD